MKALGWFFDHRSAHELTMEQLYKIVGISRQGFHQYRQRTQLEDQLACRIVDRVKQHRVDHPRMGARPMYRLMQSKEEDMDLLQELGRDKFESILLDKGLIVQPVRIFHKTTYAGAFRFANLVEGLRIRQLNQVWVSDLTYYRLTDGWAYLTFILDLYSRRCIGYQMSQTMVAEHTTIPALRMALQCRGIDKYQDQLIFHSDAGGQYYDQEFLALLKQYQIRSSMAEIVYENPHMERFHSTAKNDYLIPWAVNSIGQLKKQIHRFVRLYNEEKPHRSLKNKTPQDFEALISKMPVSQRPVMVFKKVD